MTLNLFSHDHPLEIASGAFLLKGFIEDDASLLSSIRDIAEQSPFRHMMTARGFRMSVAMTNCGPYGWVSDRKGYRYDAIDPQTGRPWPAMPLALLALAQETAALAGYRDFRPDACLINQYETGAKLYLHQDKDEKDLKAPIVSVSLGVPATFLFGGSERDDQKQKIKLEHGDVVVWGGPARLAYHGILPLKAGFHFSFGSQRINLTFRTVR